MFEDESIAIGRRSMSSENNKYSTWAILTHQEGLRLLERRYLCKGEMSKGFSSYGFWLFDYKNDA